MTIETKFNINDLVQYKFQRDNIGDHPVAFEVIEIKTVTCYTTAQIFYIVRPIHALSKMNYETKVRSVIEILGARFKESEYSSFREDEIKNCDEKIREVILNIEPKQEIANS